MATSSRLGSRTYGSRMNVAGWPNRGERNESRGSIPSIALQVAREAGDAGGEALDVLVGRVDGEARAQRAPDAEPLHERLGAVVAGADGDAPLVEERGPVVRVDPIDVEGHHCPLDLGIPRAIHGDPGDGGEGVDALRGDGLLEGGHPRHAELLEVR